ncbi:MAG: bifunctional DNA-formamidopyrimidine glycosylase/DNA-(apurinic or apyrimidinic site) lyase [Phycisphaeraceae bacterium]|nr:bifunctional DNA-formamidopyrimidine glycosylase/DNA-(apurinic or apyrimidinic site) lyase [Phycisphaeraceae bacterium]
MPELPEVETVRRTLARHALGRKVVAVAVHRPDMVEGDRSLHALLQGQRIVEITRHGKQLAIRAGTCVCVHLGMTGSLCCVTPDKSREEKHRSPSGTATPTAKRLHIHLSWTLDNGKRIEFRDPRRFGGVWTFPRMDTLRNVRWKTLGPDALKIRAAELADALAETNRPIKAALLDQTLVAGLGNIYVDEALFAAGVHPLTNCRQIASAPLQTLHARIREILARAIEAGGSTLRDYVDAEGAAGGYQKQHQVYGRSGQPCRKCQTVLKSLRLSGRMTVYCPRCQPPPTNARQSSRRRA